MSKNLDIIRGGDIVEIVKPDFVLFVGYNINFKSIRQEIVTKHSSDINALLRIVGVGRWDKVHDKILNALTYGVLGKRIGNIGDRKIFTESRPDFVGQTATVISKKVAKTGRYFPGCGDGFWEDHEPPELRDVVTHVILELDGPSDDPLQYPILIESCNVKKIK